MKTQISKESLFTYFAGRATALQKQAIDEWAKDEQNREVFFKHLAAWENQNLQFVPDDRKAFMRHQQRLLDRAVREPTAPSLTVSAEPRTLRLKQNWFRWLVAASVSLTAVAAGMYANDSLLYSTYHTHFGETRTVQLPDGSRITLNANSSLRVPRFQFGRQNRKVVLRGEADFAIKHLPDHQPFVVRTDKNFEVIVLGTEFLVNTREQGKKVVLSTGKVRLLYQEGTANKQLLMKPGHLVTFDHRGRANLKQTLQPGNFTSWKDHRFVFDGTTLAEISTLFAQHYGVTLQIPDKVLAQWTISGAFTAHSADELIETITSASNLTYQQRGSTIIITQPH